MDPTEQDANVNAEDSSPSSEGTEVSTQTPPSPPINSLADAIKRGFEASQKGNEQRTLDPKEEPKEEPSEEPEEETPEEPVEKEETETEEEDQAPEQKPEDKSPVPYSRFQEVVHARKELETKFKAIEPEVQAYRSISTYLHEAGVKPDQFQFWLEVARADAQDPARAKELLKERYESYKAATGETLPKDLLEAVEAGEMSEKYAKELASARASRDLIQKRSQKTEEELQSQRQQQHFQELQSTMAQWVKDKSRSDPDFQPKKSANAPDGKFELFIHKLATEGQRAGIQSSQDLIAFAESTLESLNKSFEAWAPRRNGSKVLTSRQTSPNLAPKKPKTLAEAVANGARKAGLNWTPPPNI